MSATQKTSPAAQLIHKLSKQPADAPVSVKTPTVLRKKRRLETDETLADPSLSDLPMEATLNPHDLPAADSADMANAFGPLAAAPGSIETDAGSHSPLQLSQLDIPVSPETSALTAAPESGALIAAPAAAAGLGMSSIFAGVAVVGVASGGGGGNTSAGIKSDVKTSEPPIKIAGTFKGLTFDETVTPVSTGQAGGSVERLTQTDGNHILKFDKGAGSAGQYAHITLSTDNTSAISKVDPIQFSSGDSKLGMWVHTAQAGTKVRLQIGDSAAGGYPNDNNWVEVETLTTKAGWDYVTFDFESPSSRFVANGAADGSRGYTDAIALKNGVTYDMVSVFFDLGVSKLSAETYYLDNLTPVALKSATPPAPIDYSTTNPIPAGYKLVLSDEFDSDVTAISPDTQKWKLETGKGPNGDGWGNGESQVYESGLDDAFLKDGALHIIAKRTGDTITSARLKSQLGDTLDPYGYVEVRAKLPAETGAWPAIWLLGQGEWPKTGEIDIVEWSARYFNDQQVQGALHFLGDNNTTKRTYGNTEFKASTTLADTIENFHTYQLWWTPEFIRIGVDGNINTAYFEYSKPANATANNWPFSNPMDMILNLAVGGTLGGDVPSGNFQYEMVVDYVRVYQTDPLASRPTTAPAAPTAAADTVVSLYSEVYTTTAGFDMPKWGPSKLLSDTTIASNHVLMGDAFTFQGFQFDAFDANTKNLGKLHLDIWSKDATPVNVYVISDGQHSEFVTITPTAGAWKGVDIDLSAFTKIDKTKIFQVKLDTMIQPTTKEMYFDNIYFAKADATTTPTTPAAPTTAPAAPTAAADTVVSLFSEAYTTTAGFDMPKWGPSKLLSDTTIASNHVLMGDAFTFQGFQFDAFDANTKNLGKLHLDIWSKDATPVNVYVISDGQHSEFVTITPTAGAWKGVDIDLSAFTKIDKTKIFQVKLDTMIQPTTKEMYFDNIYFAKADAITTPTDPTSPTAPTIAPAAPTAAADTVVSLYSEVYTTTAGFDMPKWGPSKLLSDTTIASNHVLMGDAFTFQGFQFDAFDANTKNLGKLHLDIWSKDATPVNVYVISDGQHSEFVTITPTAGAWKGVDIDLSAFTKIDKTKIFQVKLDTMIQPTTKEMYFDNIYFAKADATTTPTDPTAPALAPTKAPVVPTLAAEDVLSFFSDSYNNVTVNTWSADWDAADVATVSLENNPALKYTNLGFAGIEFTTAPVDATQMTHLHLDVWKENPSSVFKLKLVDFGANGVYQGAVNDDVEHELLFNTAGKPSLAGNQWVSVDIPLSEMTGLSTRAHLAQMIISGSGAGDTVWVDNVYLHNSAAMI